MADNPKVLSKKGRGPDNGKRKEMLSKVTGERIELTVTTVALLNTVTAERRSLIFTLPDNRLVHHKSHCQRTA